MTRRAGLLLFLGVFLLLVALTPGAIGGMGYTGEELIAAEQLISGKAVSWPRNGLTPLLVHAPFVVAAKIIGDGSPKAIDSAVAFEPIVATALIATLIFLWIRRESGDQTLALALSLAAAFATMLWPYAYIGLETIQSLALFSAAYLAFHPSRDGWGRAILFTLCAAVAVSAKSTGLFVMPAVMFLVWAMFLRDRSRSVSRLGAALLSVVLIIGLLAASTHFRNIFWATAGGNEGFIRTWMVHGPISFFLNLVSFFGSPNKGLFVFAPLTLIAVYRLPWAWRANRPLTIFALLALGGLAGGFSLLTNWSDETWGPRYLHSTIAPLVVLLGISSGGWRTRKIVAVPSFLLVVFFGFWFSLLGALFYYGSLHGAANFTGQSTLEALQGDITWNHIKFNDRLLRIWINAKFRGDNRTFWTASHRWFFLKPEDADPWKSVNLLPKARPQSVLLGSIGEPALRKFRVAGVASMLTGAALLMLLGVRTLRRPPADADREDAAYERPELS